MGAVRVTTPAGVTWTVRRRWVPHRDGVGVRERFRRTREARQSGSEALDVAGTFGGIGDDLAAIGIVIAAVAALIAIVAFGWPLVLIGIDLAWFLLVGIFGTVGRIVLRRPWRVEARSAGERRDWFVQGFRAAGRHRDEMARQLRHGQNPLGEQPATLTH